MNADARVAEIAKALEAWEFDSFGNTREEHWEAAAEIALRIADASYVQVGTWLLPETYGADYDHFTQTRCETKPGVCIAVYAKRADVQGTQYDRR